MKEFHFIFFFSFFFISIAGGFEVELIHRDSPLSPLYNSTATPRERARGATLRSLARMNTMTTKEKGLESIITMDRGEFLMALLIGTPPIQVYAFMDTGSDLVWIQCPPCLNCFTQNTPLFDPTKSSTYHQVQCGSPICRHAIRPVEYESTINCTVPTKECPYSYEYGDGLSTSGVLATEKFTFNTVKRGGTVTARNVVFGCGNNNMRKFSGSGSGIIGLGGGSLSLISQFGSNLERRFSYCLPKSAEISSIVKFGVKASFSDKVLSTPLIKDHNHPSYYFVKLDGVSIGNKRIATKKVPSGKGNTFVDSGTTLNILEPELYLNIVATTKELIGIPTVRDLTFTNDLCYPTLSLRNISVPTFTYHFTGADIELNNNLNLFISHEDITCIAIAPSYENDYNIYGNIAQKNFEVEYNLESKMVSFAPAECSWKGAGGRVQSHPFMPSTYLFYFSFFLLLNLNL